MKEIDHEHYTTKSDLISGVPGLDAYRPHSPLMWPLFFRMTSGTTGSGFALLVTTRPNSRQHALYLEKFTRPLIVVHPKRCTAMQWTCLFVEQDTSRILVLNRIDLTDPTLADLLREFEPAHIYGFAGLVLELIHTIKKRGGRILAQIRETLLIGETLAPNTRAELQVALPHSTIESAYATAEARVIGTPCAHLSGRYPANAARVFHPLEPSSLRIVEPDALGVGEIAVRTTEFGWYLTGDAGTRISEECSCGAHDTLTVFGRLSYDLVHCAGATFRIDEVTRVMKMLSRYVEDYRFTISEKIVDGRLRGSVLLELVPTEALRATPLPERFIADHIQMHLQVTPTRTLGDLVGTVFEDLRVTMIPTITHPGKKIHLRKEDTPNLR